MKSLRKRPKREYNLEEDRLTQLPDEVLAQILSCLTLKDDVKSTVLSQKWRSLWKLASGFPFNVSNKPFTLCNNQMIKIADESECKKLVSYLGGSDDYPSIDGFTACFNLDASADDSIDEWIMSAANMKRLRKLDVRIKTQLSISLAFLKSSYLTIVSLSNVRISGETIDYLLSHCSHLETLHIYRVRGCTNLKVKGPSLQLKVLIVDQCFPSIQLCAPKVEKFQYFAAGENHCIGDNPSLSELLVGWLQKPLATILLPFYSKFSQLRILYIYISWEDTIEIPDITGLVNLRHLTFDIRAAGCESLLGLTKFIETNPSLEKFTMRFGRIVDYYWIEKRGEMKQEAKEESSQAKSGRRKKKPLVRPHECLKSVELIGFSGSRNDYVLARYLIKNSINLEKMLVDVKYPGFYYYPDEIRNMRKIPKGVENLRKKLRPGVQLQFKGIQ